MDLFTIAAKLKMDTSDFDASVNGAISSGNTLKNKLSKGFSAIKKAAAAAVSVAVIKKGIDAVTGLANAVAEAGDRIDKQSQALGMSRQAYQEWDYILSQSGSSIDSLGTSMKTLNTAITSGSKDSAAALQKLGLSASSLSKLSQEDAFEKVVKAFQKLPEGAEKSALAVKLFGRNGQELLPLLNSTAGSIDDLKNKAKELGLIMSDDAVDASVKYTDALDTLKRTFNGLKFNIGAKLLPVFTDITEKVTKYIAKLRKAFEKGGVINVLKVVIKDIKASWPKWADVQKAAENAWNNIKDKAQEAAARILGSLGVDVLARVNEDGSHEFIKWPEWSEVEAAALKKWEEFKKNAADAFNNAGKMIFGTTESGDIAWPDWDTVIKAAKDWWETLVGWVKNAANLGAKLVFGSAEDGSVAWPDIEDIKKAATDLWDKLVAHVSSFVTAIKENQIIQFPTLKEITDKATQLYNDLTSAIKDINWYEVGKTISSTIFDVIKSFFGGGEGGEGADWDALASSAVSYLGNAIAALGQFFVGLLSPFAEEVSNWWEENISDPIQDDITVAVGWVEDTWADIQAAIEGIPDWIDENIVTPIEEFIESIVAWFDESIITPIEETIDTVVTFIDTDIIAPIEESIEAIVEWFGANIIEPIKETISDVTSWLDTDVVTPIKSTIEAIVSWFDTNIVTPIKNKIEPIVSWIDTNIVTPIENTLQTISTWFDTNVVTPIKTAIEGILAPFQSIVDTVSAWLGKEETKVINVEERHYQTFVGGSGTEHSGVGGNFAKGEPTIPYDNFPAILHRGEMVLTSSQARQYREGKGGVNLGALTSAIVGAVREGMRNAQVNAYMDGKEVTDNVSRRMANEFKAMRYAT